MLTASALQDDVTSDVRRTLVDYLTGAGARPSAVRQPDGVRLGRTIQAKIRGVVALTLNLPVNQLN